MDTNKPLNISVICSFTSNLVYERAYAVTALGHNVELITPRAYGDLKAANNFKQLAIKERGSNRPKVLSVLYEMRLLYGALKEFKPNLIHIHFAGGPYAAYAVVFSDVPVVISIMGGDVLYQEQPHPTWSSVILSKLIIRAANGITTKSKALAEVVKRYASKEVPIIPINWGVDLNVFKPQIDTSTLRGKCGFKSEDFVFFCPRKIEPIYNIKNLIQSFAKVSAVQGHGRLLLCEQSSFPGYVEECKHLIRALGVQDKVTFIQELQHSDMPQYYNMADAVVSVPLSDGLPQSLLEAMACGRPCIISRLERYNELVAPQVEALTVNPQNTEDIATTMSELISSPELQKRLAKAARSKLESYSNRQSELVKINGLYLDLVKQSPQRRCGRTMKVAILLTTTAHFVETALRLFLRKSFPMWLTPSKQGKQ